MFYQDLKKPDGRSMTLYSQRPIPSGMEAPSPRAHPVTEQPHLRWHPLRGEWVSYAKHRQDRTFLPPAEYNPLAPQSSKEFPTEMPVGDYDIAVFDNLFSSLSLKSEAPPSAESPFFLTGAANGHCEVVVFAQSAKESLGSLSLGHIELLLEVWADRTQRLANTPGIQFVMPFENRGVEMGVTLHHPHGQIYSYPFVPSVAAKQLENQKAYLEKEGRNLLSDMLKTEIKDEKRMIYHGKEASAFIPFCARYPYETWVMPHRSVEFLSDLTLDERADLARALKTTLLKFDGLWSRPFPYLMVMYQAPTDGKPHPEAHLHFEFYPALRSPGKLKYLAGTEIGGGMFANDSEPEDKAAELQAVKVKLE